MGLKPSGDLLASGFGSFEAARAAMQSNEYDSMAKLANNENPWGPPKISIDAMNEVWKYSGRYGYPDPGLATTVAQHHGVEPGNLLFGAGSSETLTVMGQTFLSPGKKIIGCMPTYMSVYNYATAMGAEGITAPLNADGTQNIDAMIKLAKRHYRDVGFFYLVNPNNPTGVVVTKEDVARVVNEVPEDMMILIDEAYHHFVVDDPRYESALKYVKEGRNVVVARTFSKIYGLAGMRLGYGVARADVIERMRRVTTGTQNISALVKYGAVAALKDPQEEVRVRNLINGLRKTTVAQIEATGYKVLPSNANFYMVAIRREVGPVIQEFRNRGVLVGRAFPPMTQHMRVSVGTEEENTRFVNAFKQIFTGATQSGRG
jgi:histidinol-phosphate aminotransferase